MVNKDLECYWRKTRDESRIRATIKAYLVAFTAVKHLCFSALIASAKNLPVALFRVTWNLLGKEGSEVYLQGFTEEFSAHLVDKITQVHSQLVQVLGEFGSLTNISNPTLSLLLLLPSDK